MWKLNPMRTLGVAAIALVALSALAGVGRLGSSSVLAAGQQTEPLRIEVTLDEYSFAPEPLRIPAGRPVTLVIRNVGRVAHEFMAGREVADNDFRQDLFADLHVNIEQAEQVAAGHDEHGGHADHGDHGDHGDMVTTRRHTPRQTSMAVGTIMMPPRRPMRGTHTGKGTSTARWSRPQPVRRFS